jgi:hypothetical protein
LRADIQTITSVPNAVRYFGTISDLSFRTITENFIIRSDALNADAIGTEVMTMEIELKPCPFCGGEAKYESSLNVTPLQDENVAYVDYDEMYYLERTYCTECGAEIISESEMRKKKSQ